VIKLTPKPEVGIIEPGSIVRLTELKRKEIVIEGNLKIQATSLSTQPANSTFNPICVYPAHPLYLRSCLSTRKLADL
jgi:hypothetical protein